MIIEQIIATSVLVCTNFYGDRLNIDAEFVKADEDYIKVEHSVANESVYYMSNKGVNYRIDLRYIDKNTVSASRVGTSYSDTEVTRFTCKINK